MGEPLGEQNHPHFEFGGTYAPNVPPYCLGCQWNSLPFLVKQVIDLHKKKAANYMPLAAFKLASGGAGGI
jgi:hypothetical protein